MERLASEYLLPGGGGRSPGDSGSAPSQPPQVAPTPSDSDGSRGDEDPESGSTFEQHIQSSVTKTSTEAGAGKTSGVLIAALVITGGLGAVCGVTAGACRLGHLCGFPRATVMSSRGKHHGDHRATHGQVHLELPQVHAHMLVRDHSAASTVTIDGDFIPTVTDTRV
mmetsp:Transcript_11017/g.29838  ORF Transcript_11017/g.29838 Transcript_11017/m.29838 type:complete len:167 (+) Transcript_11017:1-501(+)